MSKKVIWENKTEMKFMEIAFYRVSLIFSAQIIYFFYWQIESCLYLKITNYLISFDCLCIYHNILELTNIFIYTDVHKNNFVCIFMLAETLFH